MLEYDYSEAPGRVLVEVRRGRHAAPPRRHATASSPTADVDARALRPRGRARGAAARLLKRRAAGLIMGSALEGAEEAGRSRRVIGARLRNRVAAASSLARLMRILLFTGKGGVGKTTVAAATATRAARAGLRTIVVLDRSRALARRRVRRRRSATARPPIAPRLWGQQLNARVRFEEAWDDVRTLHGRRARLGRRRRRRSRGARGGPRASTRCSRSPTSRSSRRRGDYDLVVVDCAPTAETIRLLSLPDVLGWYMDRVFDDAAPAHPARPARPAARVGHADRGRRGVRRDPAVLRPPRRRARAAHRRRRHERAARREPRAARRRRSAAHVHVPLAVRLPRRRGDREPHPARPSSTTRGSRSGRRRSRRTSR